MSKGDHALTASYGKKDSARLYREQQHQLISQGKLREAIQMDIDDIHATFGDKYDQGIKQMLQYADRLNYNKRSGIPINPTFKQARSIARSMGR
jgi:filamentous hemagglutinin